MATFYTKVQITLTDTDVPYETDVVDTAVSYTHLTLPTILLV